MITTQQKKQAINYLSGLIEASRIYTINTTTNRSLSLREKSWATHQPRSIELLIANCYTPVADFTSQYAKNIQQNIWTSPIFYKDQNTSFVRLAEKESWRAGKSLKRYTKKEINEILHLRDIEKKVLELYGNPLSYYQPKTERLEESLRQFQMHPVNLDYSHLQPGDQGYGCAENRESKIYKLPREIQRDISDTIMFSSIICIMP